MVRRGSSATYPDNLNTEYLPMADGNLRSLIGNLDHEESERLIRYVEGRSIPEEVALVEHWLAVNPLRRELLERMTRARLVARMAPELWNVDDAWYRFAAQLDAGEDTAPVVDDVVAGAPLPTAPARVLPFRSRQKLDLPGKRQRAGGLAVALRAAALVAAMVGGATLWQHRTALFTPAEVPLQEVAAGTRERVRLTLADGTTVILAPESRIWFPERFGSTRELRLEGEAVFDVATDSARTFRVLTDAATTQVLGTRFGVRAYPEDEYVEVVVAEGRVAVEATAAPGASAAAGEAELIGRAGTHGSALIPAATAPPRVLLTPGLAVRVAADGTLGTPRAVEAERILGWTEGHLFFDKAPLAEVARTLKRRYGVEIELADQRMAELRLTAEFLQPGKVAEVVRLISVTLGIEHRKTATGFRLFHPTTTVDTDHVGGLD